jgi:hypothetical protein
MKVSRLMKRTDQVIHHQGKGRPDGKKKEKARRGKNPNSQEGLYMEAMENYGKREKRPKR